MKNKVSHFEIPAEDLLEAQKFYGSAFGWTFKPWDESYIMVTAANSNEDGMSIESGSINGGLQKRGSRAQNPTIVIEVGDIDGVIDKIQVLGGNVPIPKEKIGEMGFYAQFEDLDGNRLGLFQANK